ncbi:unnamed protein product, partial [Ixodes hexagonus]
GKKNAFYADLCEALVAANIPWAKVENPVFKEFLQKYSNELGDSCIWVSVDETTDATGRFVTHLVVGKLVADERTTPFLVCSKTLERTNGETVAYFVNASLKVLYPTGLEDSRVLLLYTDAAAYMLKAALLLKAFYPRMLHVTCLAHGIHRICEELRKHFKHVNDLVAAVKAVFLKSLSRVCAFKEQLP